MTAKKLLKDRLAALIEEDDRRRADEAEEQLRLEEAADLQDRKEAERLFAGIEEAAAEALKAGLDSISLYAHESVGADLVSLTGVAAHLRHLVSEDGLGDHLYVDIDCSGNHTIKNDLRLSLREPAPRRRRH